MGFENWIFEKYYSPEELKAINDRIKEEREKRPSLFASMLDKQKSIGENYGQA